jgi:hypothetical protein
MVKMESLMYVIYFTQVKYILCVIYFTQVKTNNVNDTITLLI